MLPDYESLDLFYLGTMAEESTEAPRSDALMLYKNSRFTTHAAIIGMTGSGKTGLGIGLLEEAVLDDIPLLIIDPKGDMANLALAFKGLEPEAMEPWMDPEEARSRGITTLELAREKAQAWERGLSQSHQGTERLARYADKADITVYTPGSTAGTSVNVLGSFAAPPAEILDDADTFAALLHSAATGLLSLIGETQADDGTDPAYLLLVSVLRHFWLKQTDLGMEALIGAVVNPPFAKLGLLDLSVAFPQKERLALAMKLNGVLASPTFSAWTQGEALDVGRMLFTERGTPRGAIFYLAHLGDAQRMFFVTMLLGRTVEWIRTQSGSSRLRALLYMDEVFGYFPPSKNTPAKASMMLLLKQARAFGFGVVLSTQNPADLDYRALSNIGTWFIGRLQTERDREKVLQGIVGDEEQKQQLAARIAQLPGRTFLMYSAKEKEPLLFRTRWALSYLKGPLSKNEIARLNKNEKSDTEASAAPHPEKIPSPEETLEHKPLLPFRIEEGYIDSSAPEAAVRLKPALYAETRCRFFDAANSIWRSLGTTLCLDLEGSEAADWDKAQILDTPAILQSSVKHAAGYAALPAWMERTTAASRIEKSLVAYLYGTRTLPMLRCPSLRLDAAPDESPDAFRNRILVMLEHRYDEAARTLHDRYARKSQKLQERLARLQRKLEKEKEDVSSAVTDTAVNIGLALFDLFSGGGRVRSSASKAARGIRNGRKAYDERGDVTAAEQEIDALGMQMEALEKEYAVQKAALKTKLSLENHPVTTRHLKPRKSDIRVDKLILLWHT